MNLYIKFKLWVQSMCPATIRHDLTDVAISGTEILVAKELERLSKL